MRRSVTTGVTVALRSVFAGFWLCAAGTVSASAQGAFYTATPQEAAGTPGTVIRTEAMSGAPFDAATYRVLYRSTGLNGEPITVSGAVIVPKTPAPAGGRKIVAWAHPTTGIVPRCAPSLAFFMFQQIQGLRDMVEHGYVVAVTDYPGLGTPGPHPYLVGVSEGRAVLDMVRAAKAIPGADAGSDYALWGHSQGGQAVLYAGLMAKDYAPEINLVGIAAAAPATELGPLMEADLDTSGGENLLAMTLWSWAQIYDAPIASVVEPAAMPNVDKLAALCLESPIDIPGRDAIGKELQKQFLSATNLISLEPWKTLLATNTIGTLPPDIPLFVAQGTADDTVHPAVTEAYVKALCAAGSKVELSLVPNVGHGTIALESARTAVAWMADRFAGAPFPGNCGAQ